MDRKELIGLLRGSICEVRFTKVDGTERVMPVTLREDLLPPARKQDPVTQKKVRDINEAVVIAYCTDKREWRSFRVANVLEVKELPDV